MAKKSELRIGQHVKFRRSHDKAVELTGRIKGISAKEDVCLVKTEADGRIVEIYGLETAHVGDVTVIEEAKTETAAAAPIPEPGTAGTRQPAQDADEELIEEAKTETAAAAPIPEPGTAGTGQPAQDADEEYED